jgi:alpha-L-fucosidase
MMLLAGAAILPAVAQLEESKPDIRPVDHPVAAIQDKETPAEHDARMAWWRNARFGMFIYWGLCSIPAGTWNGEQDQHIGGWIMNDMSIPSRSTKRWPAISIRRLFGA